MSDNALGDYFYAQSKKDGAYEAYCHASVKLELETIKCRLAEIRSQAEPLDKLLTEKMSERDRLYASAFYVVVGRMPPL